MNATSSNDNGGSAVGDAIVTQLCGIGRPELAGRARAQLRAMIGAWSISSRDETTLTIKWRARASNGANVVVIELTPADVYELRFYRVRGARMTSLASIGDVYADSLRETFERATGLVLTMPRVIMGAAPIDTCQPYKVRASCGHIDERLMRAATAGVAWGPDVVLDGSRGLPCKACRGAS